MRLSSRFVRTLPGFTPRSSRLHPQLIANLLPKRLLLCVIAFACVAFAQPANEPGAADRVVFEVQLVQANRQAQDAIGRERKQRGNLAAASAQALERFRRTDLTRVHVLKDGTFGDALVGDQVRTQAASQLARLRLETAMGREAVYLIGGRYPTPRKRVEATGVIRRQPQPGAGGGGRTGAPTPRPGPNGPPLPPIPDVQPPQQQGPQGRSPVAVNEPEPPGAAEAAGLAQLPPPPGPPPPGPLQEFGARLSFLPIERPDGSLRVRIRSQVRCVNFDKSIVRDGYEEPALETRLADRYEDVKPGQSFALTGVFDRALLEELAKIPGMGTRRLFQQIRDEHAAKANTSLGHCQVNGSRRQSAHGIPVSASPIPTRNHQPRRLAVPSVHAELSRCRGLAR